MVAVQRIAREWLPLTEHAAAALPGQLGVFEISAAGETIAIGYAGGMEPFGLRSALGAAAQQWADAYFRYETTHAYLTRWQELLMLHEHDYGRLPVANVVDAHRLGQLS